MTTRISQDSFPVLTEEERDLIGKLWRATPGLSLRQRYASVYWNMLPQIACRLGVAIDAQTAYLDQIAYAVIGEAIEDGLLRESSLGLLIEAIYYAVGGSYTLQERGRLCLCPDRVRYSFRPRTQHASACDGLWQAFHYAAVDLLHYPRCLLTIGKPYVFLDVTTLGHGPCEPEDTVAIQQAIAASLRLNVRAIQQAWLVPGPFEPLLPDDATAAAQLASRAVESLETLLGERSLDFATVALIPVIEDDAVSQAIAECLLLLQQHNAPVPFWIGMCWENQRGWRVLDPVYGREEPVPLKVSASCYSDDHHVEVERFDATPWFEQATDGELLSLYAEHFIGSYVADEVVLLCAAMNQEVEGLLAYLGLVGERYVNASGHKGFGCCVNRDEACTWIRRYRPQIWAEIVQRESNNAR